ncbi:MAG TPA: gliding motility protein GldC [Chitinophagaceae bacterium]
MEKSTITLDVHLNKDKLPEELYWSSTGSGQPEPMKAKAFILSLWDGQEKTALRIDIWTKDMMVDEMADFFYQTMVTMADTYNRATHDEEAVNEMKAFARGFYQKFREKQLKENKLT